MKKTGIVALTFLLASMAAAKKSTVYKAQGFDPSSVSAVAVFGEGCEGAIDCGRVVNALVSGAGNCFDRVLPGVLSMSVLMSLGETEFPRGRQGRKEIMPDLLAALDEAGHPVDAILVFSVPSSTKGAGLWGGGRQASSEVSLKIAVYSPGGAVLMTITGSRRPMNRVAGPESVLSTLARDFFRQACGKEKGR